jgi:hypothetical protein
VGGITLNSLHLFLHKILSVLLLGLLSPVRETELGEQGGRHRPLNSTGLPHNLSLSVNTTVTDFSKPRGKTTQSPCIYPLNPLGKRAQLSSLGYFPVFTTDPRYGWTIRSKKPI